jgi:hypothetical protein
MENSKFFKVICFIGISFSLLGSGCSGNDEYDNKLQNHVVFSGRVVTFNRSGNHSYGVIGIHITKSNTPMIKDTLDFIQMPYRVEGSYGEFYGLVPGEIQINDSIIVESDKYSARFFRNGNQYFNTGLHYDGQERNIEYVKEYTKFKNH